MTKRKKAAKKKPVTKKSPGKKKRIVARSVTVKTVGKNPKRAKKSPFYTIPGLKQKIREKLNEDLKDQLFKRDKATTHKQHRTAQLKIDSIRRELRKVE